ncbi:MAG: lipopolysaccharide kinase InaA family protein [Methylophaga sp.]|nr:lipopolysaccharide kinase InaA family protein [Methylophaga sp.]
MKSSPEQQRELVNGPLMDLRQLGNALKYVVKGRLALPGGHLPQPAHQVPEDFIGVGATTGDDPEIDDFILAKLTELNLQQVRLDFTYTDLNGPVSRLLDKLLTAKISVLLHLVQPFREAQQMKNSEAQERWQAFVETVTEQFGHRVYAIEIGTTSNRRHWSGYDTESFFHTWRIAHNIIRKQRIKLAGPNISDFEPLHNIAVLSRLQRELQLPDIHTNNLFSERVTEPERFDHRIFGTKLALKLKVNLVKKARLLQKITTDFAVKSFISPAAFWTLPRIRRLLVHGEQKQADYLTRYFTLLAASGALQQAFWGPFLCSREGLVDDGSGVYPKLERITHYQSVLGQRADFRERPAFYALQQFIRQIPGSFYQGPLATTENLEVHAFRRSDALVHVLWTINGKAMALNQLYDIESLAKAECYSRDGEQLTEMPEFAGESPIYLRWPVGTLVSFQDPHGKGLDAWYRYMPGKQLYQFQQAGWQGLLLAENQTDAEFLRRTLQPATLPAALPDNTLRRARNVIWRLDNILDRPFIAKQPLKMHAHKRLLDRWRPSKAKRSWIAAAELLRRGIATAKPIAYFEKTNDKTLLQNLYLCEQVDHDFSARDLFTAFRDGASEFQGVCEAQAYPQLATFLNDMHARGVFFRDLAGGNILIKKQADGTLAFTLIDINRARFFNRNATLSERLSDLARICHKLHWPGREQLLDEYLALNRKFGKTFSWRMKLPFYLYDYKVNFKRKYGRKAIRRWWQARKQG